jgi:hypothetical protein
MSDHSQKEEIISRVIIIHDELFGLAVTKQLDVILNEFCYIDFLENRRVEVIKYLSSEVVSIALEQGLIEKSTYGESYGIENHVVVILQVEKPELISDVHSYMKGSSAWLHIVYLKDDVLFLGPHFKDGESGCYDCFRRRRMTHMSGGGSVSSEKFIEKCLESNPRYVVTGYPPMFPSIAAQRLMNAVFFPKKHLRTASHISGLNHAIKSCRIIALHGCKCRGNTVDAKRYYRYFEKTMAGSC